MEPKIKFDDIIKSLPISPQSLDGDRVVKFWNNGAGEIMCRTEEAMAALADFLQELGFEDVYIGYYVSTDWYFVSLE